MKRVIALLVFMSVLHAINLTDRNFYSDEVRLTNPCLKNHTQDIKENGWFPYMAECADKGILQTDYGAVIAENITVYTWEGMDKNKSGRINGVLEGGPFVGVFREVPAVRAKGYKPEDSKEYGKRVVSVITEKFQYNFFDIKLNCIDYITPEVIQPTDNLIKSIHFLFPYIHVVKTETGWCFNEP